jgi:2-polyprenyl-3-methyl-5-hydroxy-6-metoxy-1,4-benzoquinol methylase
MSNSLIPEMARQGVHKKVLSYMEGKAPARVLDCPAGPGALAGKLKVMGFEVSCCDMEPENFRMEGLKCNYGNLNGKLPYKDGEFDFVLCVEGIEHTENPYNAIGELSRVLKLDGVLVLTTPNYLNIERRLKFLVMGSFTKPVSLEFFKENLGEDASGLHLSTLGYTEIKFALERVGFEIKELTYDREKPKQKFLKPLVLLIRLYTRIWSKESRQRYLIDEA